MPGPVRISGCLVGLAILLCTAAATALAFDQDWIEWPKHAFPWQAPDLAGAPGLFAHMQIRHAAADRRLCQSVLAQSGLGFTPLADRRIDDRCGYTDVVRLDAPPIAFDHSTTATCGLALSLDWFEHLLVPLARRDLGARIVRIDQVGTFACRNVNGEAVGPRSEHATANAIDITGFRLSDGRVVSVAADYGKPTPAGRFLDDAHDAACAVFNGVLGPRYNRLHATHFHLDLGPHGICS